MASVQEIGFKNRLTALRVQQQAASQRVSQISSAAQEAEGKKSQAAEEVMSLKFFIPVEIFCIILDLIDFFTAGTVGWAIGIVGDLILLGLTGMSKGSRKQARKILLAVLGEKIPIVAALPLRSIMFGWAFIKSNPKGAQLLGIATFNPGLIAAGTSIRAKRRLTGETGRAQQARGFTPTQPQEAPAPAVQRGFPTQGAASRPIPGTASLRPAA